MTSHAFVNEPSGCRSSPSGIESRRVKPGYCKRLAAVRAGDHLTEGIASASGTALVCWLREASADFAGEARHGFSLGSVRFKANSSEQIREDLKCIGEPRVITGDVAIIGIEKSETLFHGKAKASSNDIARAVHASVEPFMDHRVHNNIKASLGRQSTLGLSTGSREGGAMIAILAGDYLLIGPVSPEETKHTGAHPVFLEGL
jgi:hypothetical protein